MWRVLKELKQPVKNLWPFSRRISSSTNSPFHLTILICYSSQDCGFPTKGRFIKIDIFAFLFPWSRWGYSPCLSPLDPLCYQIPDAIAVKSSLDFWTLYWGSKNIPSIPSINSVSLALGEDHKHPEIVPRSIEQYSLPEVFWKIFVAHIIWSFPVRTLSIWKRTIQFPQFSINPFHTCVKNHTE